MIRGAGCAPPVVSAGALLAAWCAPSLATWSLTCAVVLSQSVIMRLDAAAGRARAELAELAELRRAAGDQVPPPDFWARQMQHPN